MTTLLMLIVIGSSLSEKWGGEIAPPAALSVNVYVTENRESIKFFIDMRHNTGFDFHYRNQRDNLPKWVVERLKAGEKFPFIEWKTAKGRFYIHGKQQQDFKAYYERSLR